MSIDVTIESLDLPDDVKISAASELTRVISEVKRLVLATLGVLEANIDDADEIEDLQAAIAAETRARYYVRGTPAEQTATRFGGSYYSADAYQLVNSWYDPWLSPEYTSESDIPWK